MSKPSAHSAVAPILLPAELTWSRSQQTTFDDCPRARYWATELAPTGWKRDASLISRAAYLLKTLTTLDMECGRVLHERAAECAVSVRAGEPIPALVSLREMSRARLRYVWVSQNRIPEWRLHPKSIPMLMDAYYGRGPTMDQAVRVRERLEQCTVVLKDLSLWAELAACHADDIAVVDKLDAYILPAAPIQGTSACAADHAADNSCSDDGMCPPVRVWAAPDLIMRADPDAQWEVVDYKSGRAEVGEPLKRAMAQVVSYGVYLRHGLRAIGPNDSCRGRLILLGDGREMEFEIRASDLDVAEERIRRGALAMRIARDTADRAEVEARLRAEKEGAPPKERDALIELARRSAYPMTQSRTRCHGCRYLELCRPEQAGEVADAGAPLQASTGHEVRVDADAA